MVLRAFILGILIGFSSLSLSQDLPKKVKYDSLLYSGDSSYVAVFKKKKSGIYNVKKGEYALPMTKHQTIIHSPYFNIFTVFNKEGFKSYEAFNPELLKELDKNNTMVGGAKFLIEEMSDGKYLVTNIEYKFSGVQKDGVLKFNYDEPFEGSGVYNHELKKWEVPRKYTEIFELGNALFALKHEETEWEMDGDIKKKASYIGHYDIYTRNKAGLWTLNKENVSSVDEIPAQIVFGYDEIKSNENLPTHHQGKRKDGKWDYFIMDLFMDGFSWNPEVKFEMVSERIELAVVHEEESLIITYGSLDSLPIKLFGFKKDKHPLDTTYTFLLEEGKINVRYGTNDLETFRIYGDKESRMLSTLNFQKGTIKMNFGIQKLNDELIKVYNSSFERFQRLESVMYPGEDSINFNGNTVYEPQGSTSATGIYNVKSGKWEIEPFYYDCHLGREIKVYGHLYRETDDRNMYEINYNLVHDSGEDWSDIPADTLAANQYVLGEVLWDINADKVFPVRQNGGPLFYYETKGKIGTIEVYDLMLGQYNITPPADYLYNNPDIRFVFKLENDSIQLSFRDTLYQVPAKNGKIILNYDAIDNGLNGPWVEIYLVENGDSTSFAFEDHLIHTSKTSASLELDENGRLVMNDEMYQFVTLWGYEMDDEVVLKVSLHSSAIWEYYENKWEKASPSYMGIHETNGSYICRLELLEYIPNSYTSDYVDHYVILNDALLPLTFYDYYNFPKVEDLGFGLKVCTDKGCMFVTYDHQIITKDEWDDFKLAKDGRLMAIGKKPVIENDQIIAHDGVVGYFVLPKK